MSMRTGTVRTAMRLMVSSGRSRRSEDAGGAAIAEGASARGGAGMNEAGRGFSVESHAAAGAPLEVMRVRARRPRFFSGSGAPGAVGAAGFTGRTATGLLIEIGRPAGFGATFGLTTLAAAFEAIFAAAFGAVLATFVATFAAAFFTLTAAFFTCLTGFAACFGGFAGLAGLTGFFGVAAFFGAAFFATVFTAFFTRAATFFAASLPRAAGFFPCALAMKVPLRKVG